MGGGKSRYARAEAVLFSQLVPGSATLILRRKYVDLVKPGAMVPAMRQEMPSGLGIYNETLHEWRMANGSTITFGYLEKDKDTDRYQGSEIQLLIVDEAGQFPERHIDYVQTRLRASGNVKRRLAELGMRPRMILTANPGGIGHAWLRRRYVSPVPAGQLWRPRPTPDRPAPRTRLYVPAKATDNPYLDDDYVRNLDLLPADQRAALRDGSWDSFSGNALPTFNRDVHVLEEVPPYPQGADTLAWGVDFGFAAPFAAVLGQLLPDGMVLIHAEIEEKELTPAQQIDMVLSRERENWRTAGRSVPIALDPSTWARNPHAVSKPRGLIYDGTVGAPPQESIARAYYDRVGSALEKGINDRLGGWNLLRDRLEVRPDGLPRLLISPACTKLIAKLPALPRSDKNPEDVDTKSDDHLADATRYLLMHFASRFNELGTAEQEMEKARENALADAWRPRGPLEVEEDFERLRW